eukprot:gene3054-5987_t
MDWARIEQEVQTKTAALLKTKSRFDPHTFDNGALSDSSNHTYAENQYYPQKISPQINSYSQPDQQVSTSEVAMMFREISDLKTQLTYQNQKINGMERVTRSLNEMLESNASAQHQYAERLDQYELDLHAVSKYTLNANRERADVNIQTKTTNLRLQQMEEAIRRGEETYVTKIAFTQLLNTCVDQLQTVSTAADSARASSELFASFADTLLLALWDLRGSQSGFRLEFLSGLTPEQLTRLLRDALANAVHIPVATQLDTAALSLRDALDNSRKQLAKDLEELQSRYSLQIASIDSKVDKCQEVMSQMDLVIRVQRVTARDVTSLQDTIHEIEDQRREWLEGLSRCTTANHRLLDTVTRVQSESENMGIKLSDHGCAVSRLAAANNDLDVKFREYNDVLERMKNAMVKQGTTVAEMRRQLEGMAKNEDYASNVARLAEHGQAIIRLQASMGEVGETLSAIALKQGKLQSSQMEQSDVLGIIQSRITAAVTTASTSTSTAAATMTSTVVAVANNPKQCKSTDDGNNSNEEKEKELLSIRRDLVRLDKLSATLQEDVSELRDLWQRVMQRSEATESVVTDLAEDITEIQSWRADLSIVDVNRAVSIQPPVVDSEFNMQTSDVLSVNCTGGGGDKRDETPSHGESQSPPLETADGQPSSKATIETAGVQPRKASIDMADRGSDNGTSCISSDDDEETVSTHSSESVVTPTASQSLSLPLSVAMTESTTTTTTTTTVSATATEERVGLELRSPSVSNAQDMAEGEWSSSDDSSAASDNVQQNDLDAKLSLGGGGGGGGGVTLQIDTDEILSSSRHDDFGESSFSDSSDDNDNGDGSESDPDATPGRESDEDDDDSDSEGEEEESSPDMTQQQQQQQQQRVLTGSLAGGRRSTSLAMATAGAKWSSGEASSPVTAPVAVSVPSPMGPRGYLARSLSGPIAGSGSGPGGGPWGPPLSAISFHGPPAQSPGPGSGPGPMLSSASLSVSSAALSVSQQQRENSSQCSFCLRRIPKGDVSSHHKTCSLRMENCSFGCGARIFAVKMDKHKETCPCYQQQQQQQQQDAEQESSNNGELGPESSTG